MARGQSTSNVYRRRKMRGASSRVHADTRRPSGGLPGELRSLAAALANAQAVLACLHLALLYAGEKEVADDPDYARSVAIALAVVRGAIARLDSITLAAAAKEGRTSRPAVTL
jgi:hypothetical protein